MSEDLKKKWQAKPPEGFEVHDVTTANHKPHPFCISSRHIAHASDHYCGRLGEESMRAAPCGMRGCNLSYDEHTSDLVMFLKLTRSMTSKEAQESLKPICDEVEADKIDGFAFIKNEFEFITEPNQ